MLSEEDFRFKHLQYPITFLTEENLDKLETHCRKASKIEIGIEHKVVLELLDRYYKLKKETEEKDKQIDLMAEYISKIDIEEDVCMKNKTNPDWCNEDYTNCKECIKQYFIKLAKKQEQNQLEKIKEQGYYDWEGMR